MSECVRVLLGSSCVCVCVCVCIQDEKVNDN